MKSVIVSVLALLSTQLLSVGFDLSPAQTILQQELLQAVRANNPLHVSQIISRGAKVNLMGDEQGNRPFAIAAKKFVEATSGNFWDDKTTKERQAQQEKNAAAIITQLLKAGAIPETEYKKGQTQTKKYTNKKLQKLIAANR